jgi:hypothetical protein
MNVNLSSHDVFYFLAQRRFYKKTTGCATRGRERGGPARDTDLPPIMP